MCLEIHVVKLIRLSIPVCVIDISSLDGTRIITGYTIEERPVICEWSENELQRYFRYDGRINVASSTDGTFSPSQHVDYREKLTGISIADGFVSILLTFRVEHKDYATVSYDQSAVGCTLSMPDNLCVSMSGEGHYEVSMGDQVNLKVIEVARIR